MTSRLFLLQIFLLSVIIFALHEVFDWYKTAANIRDKPFINYSNKNHDLPAVDNLGLTDRETLLANRMRDLEDQNHILKSSLSASQKQLLSYMSVNEEDGGSGNTVDVP